MLAQISVSAKILSYILTTKSKPIISAKDHVTYNYPHYNKTRNVHYKQLPTGPL